MTGHDPPRFCPVANHWKLAFKSNTRYTTNKKYRKLRGCGMPTGGAQQCHRGEQRGHWRETALPKFKFKFNSTHASTGRSQRHFPRAEDQHPSG